MRRFATIRFMFILCALCSLILGEEQSKVIEFQVVTVDQQPILGADVKLIWPYKKSEDKKESPKSFLKTITDKKGWFRFEIPDYVNKMDYYLLLVRKEGYSLGWKNIFTNREPITLYPLSRFRGKVVDVTGQPVPDALVKIVYLFKKTTDYGNYSGGIMLNDSDILPFMAVKTKEDGHFEFSMFPEGSKVEFSVKKKGYAHYYTYQLSEEIYYPKINIPHRFTGKKINMPYRERVGPQYKIGMTDVTIVLKPPATIRGMVIDKESKKPLPDMPLSLFLSGGGVIPANYRSTLRCTSDAEGNFAFSGLEKGVYVLSFDEYGDMYARAKMELEISEGQKCTDITFELIRGGKLDLELLDHKSQKGIENCAVSIENPEDAYSQVCHTNDNGKLIQQFVPGTYTIQGFEKKGYGLVSQQHIIHIQNNKTTSLSLELEEYAKTAVVVKDPDGNPVREYKLRLLGKKKGDYLETNQWQADTRSGFTVWSKLPIKERKIVAEVCDFRNNLVGMLSISVPGQESLLTLQKGLKIIGRVQDQDRNPIPSLPIHLNCRYQKEDISVLYEIGTPMDNPWTDSQGRFTLSGIPVSKYIDNINLIIMPKDYTPRRIQINPDQAVNNTIKLPVITLKKRIPHKKILPVAWSENPVKDASIMKVRNNGITSISL